jgi:hypothetical protein
VRVESPVPGEINRLTNASLSFNEAHRWVPTITPTHQNIVGNTTSGEGALGYNIKSIPEKEPKEQREEKI